MPLPPLPLDSARLRALFPAFAEPSLSGQAYFENAGGSYAARAVLDRFERYNRRTRVQPHGYFPAGAAAQAAIELSYERIAAALNVTPDWIHFGPSTSANSYVLGTAFAGWLKSGDAIVVTNQDHEANSGAWRRLESRGIEVREWRVDRHSGRLDQDVLETLLTEDVKLIAFPHVSNVVGEINPVAEITARARRLGAITVVDGVAAAPHGLPDLTALGPDIYFFSAYKTFGPHQGIMAVRPELAAALPNQSHFFNADKPRYRLNPAGPDYAQIAACAGIADYLEAVAALAGPGFEGPDPFRRAQEIALLAPLLDYLRGRNDVRLIGPDDPTLRAPTVSLALAEPALAVATRLARHGIMAGGGHFFAWRVLQGIGIEPTHGVLRLSFLHYTSRAEIDRLIAALDEEL